MFSISHSYLEKYASTQSDYDAILGKIEKIEKTHPCSPNENPIVKIWSDSLNAISSCYGQKSLCLNMRFLMLLEFGSWKGWLSKKSLIVLSSIIKIVEYSKSKGLSLNGSEIVSSAYEKTGQDFQENLLYSYDFFRFKFKELAFDYCYKIKVLSFVKPILELQTLVPIAGSAVQNENPHHEEAALKSVSWEECFPFFYKHLLCGSEMVSDSARHQYIQDLVQSICLRVLKSCDRLNADSHEKVEAFAISLPHHFCRGIISDNRKWVHVYLTLFNGEYTHGAYKKVVDTQRFSIGLLNGQDKRLFKQKNFVLLMSRGQGYEELQAAATMKSVQQLCPDADFEKQVYFGVDKFFTIKEPSIYAVYAPWGNCNLLQAKTLMGIPTSFNLNGSVYPLIYEDILNFLIKVVHDLRIFHEKNIVHRDVKPENIMLKAEVDTRTLTVNVVVYFIDYDFTMMGGICKGMACLHWDKLSVDGCYTPFTDWYSFAIMIGQLFIPNFLSSLGDLSVIMDRRKRKRAYFRYFKACRKKIRRMSLSVQGDDEQLRSQSLIKNLEALGIKNFSRGFHEFRDLLRSFLIGNKGKFENEKYFAMREMVFDTLVLELAYLLVAQARDMEAWLKIKLGIAAITNVISNGSFEERAELFKELSKEVPLVMQIDNNLSKVRDRLSSYRDDFALS